MISTIAHVTYSVVENEAGLEGVSIARDVTPEGTESWRVVLEYSGARDVDVPVADAKEAVAHALHVLPEGQPNSAIEAATAVRTIQDAVLYRAYSIAHSYAVRLEEGGHHVKLYVNYYAGSVVNAKRYSADEFRVQLSAKKDWFSSHLIVSWRTLAEGAPRRTTSRLTGMVHQQRKALKVTSARDLDAWVYALAQ
jgi:hypothetical protein